MFIPADFDRMAEQLGQIKGSFLMSVNDVPEIRERFAAFNMQRVETTYTIGTKNRGKVGELFIGNFDWGAKSDAK
ncbi:hypothetical protein [Halocynthiibacter namhaensis]|uniref:hypothetical protein n=1 Tax=Halocynthiibacter namhaensis TaxID=1290553 RepID=UPI0005790F67|nr:hypothetical protein [Halocynthiibacter namhaensis]